MTLKILGDSLIIAFVFIVGWLLGAAFAASAYQQALRQTKTQGPEAKKQ